MKIILFALVMLAAEQSCSNDINKETMDRQMAHEGITSAVYTSAVKGCGESDAYKMEFSGVKNGQQVTGAVCGDGESKGYTIRYF